MNEPRPWRWHSPEEVRAAAELYREYGPANRGLIVRGMIAKGWLEFRLSDIVGRPHRGFDGLEKLHGWLDEWRAAHPEQQQKLLTVRMPELSGEAAPDGPAAAAPEPAAAVAGPSPPSAANQDLPTWLEAIRPRWKWRWKFQLYVYNELDKLTTARSDRLMIFMPPRHGKSELVTVGYAAWRLARDARLRIIVGSYNQRLANRFSRRIKAMYLSATKSGDTDEPQLTVNAMDEWETPQGGGVKAVGVGSGVTGFGADLIIIDDPIKSRADAESKNNRERIWEWFTDDLMTRLEPGGAVILIQTRWHEDDLAGRLLGPQMQNSKCKMQNGRKKRDKWNVVCLPALAEGEPKSLKGTNIIAQGKASGRNPGNSHNNDPDPVGVEHAASDLAPLQGADDVVRDVPGVNLATLEHPGLLNVSPTATGKRPRDPLGRRPGQALCHERFPRRELLRKQLEMGSYSFSALYQQSPLPAEGALFKREWFTRIVISAPPHLRWCRGYDLAVSTKTSADYTASFRCALDKSTGDLYIADGFRARIEYPEQRRYITDRIRDERDTEHGIELALHGQAFMQELWRETGLSRFAFRGVRVTTDKFTRALAWANRAEAGRVVLVSGPWIADFLDEICTFPNAAHDDQLDSVSLAVQMLETPRNRAWAF
ncbi:MAG: phage terminase large subunit [Chloracidobacterium sp.]|nr:phage terminase large subunit [Chloracidobacterium sp.]